MFLQTRFCEIVILCPWKYLPLFCQNRPSCIVYQLIPKEDLISFRVLLFNLYARRRIYYSLQLYRVEISRCLIEMLSLEAGGRIIMCLETILYLSAMKALFSVGSARHDAWLMEDGAPRILSALKVSWLINYYVQATFKTSIRKSSQLKRFTSEFVVCYRNFKDSSCSWRCDIFLIISIFY